MPVGWEVTLMRSFVFALLALVSLSALPNAARAAGVSGKYYRYTTVNGVSKVYRDQYLDFQADGRCASRALKTGNNGDRGYTTVVISYDVSGNYVEIVGEFGFTTYEIKGDRLVSGGGGYVKASSVDPKPGAKKPAPKPSRHIARKK